MRHVNFSFGLLLSVGLTGCAVGPDYQPPDIATPPQYRFDIANRDGDTDALWWRAFGDPVLDELIDEALANNFDVRIAAGRVEEFAARIGIVRAEMIPQLSYGAEALQQQNSREIGLGKLGGDRVTAAFNASLNLTWELDLWGRVRRATEAARADLLAAEANRRGVFLTLVTSVATSYVQLRGLDEQLAIAERRLESRAETLELFQLQLEKGMISELEVAQVRSEYERTAAAIPAIRRDIAKLENALSVLLGRPPGPIARGRPLEALAAPPIPAGLPSELLERRPDLRAAEQRLVAANARIGAAIAQFFPRIALTGALGVASDELSNLATSSAGIYSIAASVTGPIFAAGRIQGQVDAAEAVTRQALDQYLQSLLSALRESEDALITVTTTRDETAAQARQVDALARYESLARRRYDNGYVDYLEVLDAERQLFDAQLQLIRLEAAELGSIIAVYKAFGGGWVDQISTPAPADDSSLE